MAEASEHYALTHNQMQQWGYHIEEETSLSPQEAQIFVRLFHMHKDDICDDLDIDKPHLKTVIARVEEKIGRAEMTGEIGRVLSSRTRATLPTMPFGSALVGCAGPNCERDVETARTNDGFQTYYTKTVNLHDSTRDIDNARGLQFCSIDCLTEHDELANK